MVEIQKSCLEYFVWLRSLSLITQQAHWTTKGSNFYGNHLLFERLYDSAQENTDAAAEKLIGIFGADCFDIKLQAELISEKLFKYVDSNLINNCLQVEKDFLAFSKEFYELLKSEGKLTLGLDDLIMSISNKQEEAVYLLQQASEKPASEKQAFKQIDKLSKLAEKFKQIIQKN